MLVSDELVLISYTWFQITGVEDLLKGEVDRVVVEETSLALVLVATAVADAEEYAEFENEYCHVEQKCEKDGLHRLFH